MASMPVLRLRNPWRGRDRERSSGSDDDRRPNRERHRENEHGEGAPRARRGRQWQGDPDRDERRRRQNDPERRRERINESRRRARGRRSSPTPVSRSSSSSNSSHSSETRRRRGTNEDVHRRRNRFRRARERARQRAGYHSGGSDVIEPAHGNTSARPVRRRTEEETDELLQQQRRERREAARVRARERRRVRQPDAGANEETGDNVTIGPLVDVGVGQASHDQLHPQQQGQPHGIDSMRMSAVASSKRGLFSAFYVWDAEAESMKQLNASERPPEFENNFDTRRMCSKCGDRNHQRNQCPLQGWVVKLFNCRKCGCTLLGAETEGVCCGRKHPITFQRRHRDETLKEMYKLRTFRKYSIHMNAMFSYVRSMMDMKFVRGGGPSFLKLYGNVAIALPVKDSSYSFLWSNDAPSLTPSTQRSTSLGQAVRDPNVQRMVPILYRRIRPRPEIMRERYRTMFNTSRFDTDPNSGVDRTEVTADAAEQQLIVENYRGTHDTSLTFQHAGGPLPDDRAGLPTYLRSFTVNSGGLFRTAAPMVQITGQSETHRDTDGTVRVRCKKIKPSSKYAEWGAFPLLYPEGEVHVPFDIGTYVSANRGPEGGSSSDSGAVTETLRRYSKMTWAEVSKRRIYTDNFLLESGGLLQQWVLKTATNIQDMRLEFLEKDQTSRIVEERELLQQFGGHDEPYKPGRLFLPDNFVDSPAYWKSKLLDVQAIVSRRFLPSLFITITANTGWETFERLGLDIQNRSSFAPAGGKPRIWDRPDLVARVYNQFANDIIKDLKQNSESYFGSKCVGIAAKLEFQARNTPHHHILLFLEGGVIENVDTIDSIISAELPTQQEDPELRALVKKFNMHRHSAYCRGRTADGRCRFGYGENQVTPETFIDETCNRAVYRRRKREDLKVVPYNAELTRKYKCHINVERTQGGGAIAYLMKYTFKPPTSRELELATSADQETAGRDRARDIARENIQNDLRLYMRARVTGAVEAVWNLLEYRHVRIEPTVEAFSIHLENERNIIIRNPAATGLPNDSPLIRYFKRPSTFNSLLFLDYFETVRFYKPTNVPARVRSGNAQLLMDNASPRACVVAKQEIDQDESVARIRFVSPSNGELFALRLILLERPMHSFRNGMNWEGVQYRTWRDTAIGMGLYQDGYEQEKAFDEAVRIRVTPSGVRFFMITLMQHGGNPRRMFEKHESYMSSDIHISSETSKRRELIRRLFEISDNHGGILLREIPFFLICKGEGNEQPPKQTWRWNIYTICRIRIGDGEHKRSSSR